jgi:ABC-type glutathione transport system ATPase component
MLGLPQAREQLPSALSGGMKKRVALARAVVSNPEVVLFDEPTTGLDPVMIEFVDDLIVRTRQTFEITSVIVSHDMASNRRLADRMAMLAEGRIVSVGDFDTVRADPRSRWCRCSWRTRWWTAWGAKRRRRTRPRRGGDPGRGGAGLAARRLDPGPGEVFRRQSCVEGH